MTVDFDVHREPSHRVATRTLTGRWPGDRAIGREYDTLHRWTRSAGLKTGKWFFRSLGEMSESAPGKWEVGIEIRTRRPLRGGSGVSIKTFPTTTVVGVRFNPGLVSPEVVYSAIGGWMRWSGKMRKFRSNGPWREVYSANPWKSKSAWRRTEIQAPVRR